MRLGLPSLFTKYRLSKHRLCQIGIGLGTLCLASLAFLPHIPKTLDLSVGDIATKTIYAPYDAFIETSKDKAKTEQLRRDRMASVPKVFSIDTEKNKLILGSIFQFFTNVKLDPSLDSNTPLVKRYQSVSAIDTLESTVFDIATALLDMGLSDDTLTNLDQLLDPMITNAAHSDLIKATLIQFLEPNLRYDKTQTEADIATILNAIQPFSTHYRKSQVIVYEGDRITQQHGAIFTAYNLINQPIPWLRLIGLLAIVFLSFYAISVLLKAPVTVPMIIIGILLIIANGLTQISFQLFSINWLYLTPISFLAIAIALLQSRRVAFLTSILASLTIGLMAPTEGLLLVMYLIGSACVTIALVNRTGRRITIIKTGYMSSLANCVLLSAAWLMHTPTLSWLFPHLVLVLISGIVSSMLALSFIPYLEIGFKITTSQTLLDFANLDHPLLKKLMTTTPGTYQHSIMVANLAEAGAEAINANPILARIGAYYHDIGKMKRPLFYSENQGAENPHDRLTPRMSKMIIAAHPKDGVELAKHHKLPDVLIDFILEHHGTSLVSFFYTQQKNDDETTEEFDFRYPGPKPKFKESGIVMLADSIEATLRSMQKLNPSKITETVDRIIKDKIADNQLNECPLTLADIETVKQAFLNCLTGVYHQRINYDKITESLNE